jgi:hypothetical protein
VVVLPGLIRAAKTVCEMLSANLEGRTVCAFELPGLGASSAPAAGVSIASVSSMLADAIAAAGLADAPVVAFDLAAPLAAALPTGAPRLMTELESARRWAQQAFRPQDLRPRDDGTHLTALFAHLRDAHVLDPVGSRRAAREGLPLPDARALDEMIVTAGWSPQAYGELWSVCLQAIPGLADDRSFPFGTLADALSTLGGTDYSEPVMQAPGHGLWRDYVDIKRGRVHLRRAGHSVRPDRTGRPDCVDHPERADRQDHSVRPLIALHSAPGSAAPLQRLIDGLGESRPVIAPDFIGNGDSSRPDAPVDIARLGRDVVELATTLGLAEYDLWGTHSAAADTGIRRRPAGKLFPRDRARHLGALPATGLEHASRHVPLLAVVQGRARGRTAAPRSGCGLPAPVGDGPADQRSHLSSQLPRRVRV